MVQRDELGHFLPGASGNPTGRPTIRVSLVKLFHDKLENTPRLADDIINAWIEACKQRDMPAIREALDRLDGKVADKHIIQGLILHVGNEYAQRGLEANRLDLEERKARYQLAQGTEQSIEP